MAQLAPLPSPTLALPALIASADDRARLRVLEFFAVTIRNAHTRRTYARSEEHTSELQSLMRISYAVFCLKKTTQPEVDQQLVEHCMHVTHIDRRKEQLAHQ